MSLFSRLRKAISGIDNPLARIILFGLSKYAVWTPADYYSLSKAGYENCMTVYACVNYIARAAAGIEWTATVGEKDAPKHSILKLLSRPNGEEGRRAFIFKCFAFFLLSGNRYVLAGRIGSQPPRALWVPRPDRMKVLPGEIKGQLVRGYEYGTPGQLPPIDPSLVMHSKLFHPTDDFYGLSPLSVAAHAVDVSNMAAEWNARLLQNDMRPPGALSTEGNLGDEQFLRLKNLMKEEWQGYENAGQPLLLEGGLKWINFMLTAKEMDWLNTTKANKRDICTVFNLDPCLVGDSEYATYSNKVEARKGAYEDVIIPFMDELCDDFNAWLSPMFGEGVALGINKDKIAALQESREKQYSYLQGTWWLRIDELRKLTGQDPVGGPAGEAIFIPLGKIPLEQAAAEPEPVPDALKPFAGGNPDDEPEPEPDDEGGKASRRTRRFKTKAGFWGDLKRKERLWLSFEGRVKSREKSFEQIAKSYLKRQAEDVKKRAVAAGAVGHLRADDLLDTKKEAKKYVETFWPWYADHFIRAGNAGMRASKGELFDDAEFKAGDPKKPTSWVFDMTPEQEDILRDMVFNSGTEVNKTAVEKILGILEKANTENWTVEQFTQEIWETLSDFEPWRARLWAQTESAKIDNYGQLEGYKQTEFVEKKGWMCSFLPTSRELHKDADARYSENPIPLDQDFEVGSDSLAYPGDPKGSPENNCNEHCSMYPVVE